MALLLAQPHRARPRTSTALRRGMETPIEAGLPRPAPSSRDAVAFRQLRHQTKNALQRLICEIARCAELQATEEGRRLVLDLERRICLTARVSDALFGMTDCPGTLEQRLRSLCGAMIGLLAGSGQRIGCEVVVEGDPSGAATGIPAAGASRMVAGVSGTVADVIVRVAHEMIGNAIKHGIADRPEGHVVVRVGVAAGHVRLQVVDDGAGPGGAAGGRPGDGAWSPGEGSALMRELAAVVNGRVSLARADGLTVAEFTARNAARPDLALLGDENG